MRTILIIIYFYEKEKSDEEDEETRSFNPKTTPSLHALCLDEKARSIHSYSVFNKWNPKEVVIFHKCYTIWTVGLSRRYRLL